MNILITGASGLIGTRLTEMLLQQGHTVSHLGRSKKTGMVPVFVWDVEKGTVDENAFHQVDAVVHLAGAGVADKRWTKNRKREILESRTKSAALLSRCLAKTETVKTVVAASAIGYYGFDSGNHEFTETDKPGSDFLASVVKDWEAEINTIQNNRLVLLRIGIVLSNRGGALMEMAKPIQWGVGSPLGTGKQYVSWIHLDDLCRMFMKAIEDITMRGVYNACGPHAVTNEDMTKAIADVLNKKLWLPAVPAPILKIVIGEMADIVVSGSIVSPRKIQQAGFQFQFPDLNQALANLFR